MKTAASSYPHVWLSDPALGSGWRSWVDKEEAPR